MELETVIDRWHRQQKSESRYGWHLGAAVVAVLIGAGLIWADHRVWGSLLILCGASFAVFRHAIDDVLVHDTLQVPDELLLLIADEPALPDTLKTQLSSLLHAQSVVTFGALRKLAQDVEQEEFKMAARTQDGFRTLASRYPVSTAQSAQ